MVFLKRRHKLGKLYIGSSQQRDWSLITSITTTKYKQPMHIHLG